MFFWNVSILFMFCCNTVKAFLATTLVSDQGPVARSLVSANRWLRGIKMLGFHGI